MEKHFLTVLHEGEVMDAMSLDMLKGGISGEECPGFSCGCFKGNVCGYNKNKETPILQP